MSYRKSATCTGKMSGQPLTEYDTAADAKEGADRAQRNYGRDLAQYVCRRCSKWHLAPAERQTPSTTCSSCTNSAGRSKQAYRTKRDAERRAEILSAERGVRLRVYACEWGSGWHLTSS